MLFATRGGLGLTPQQRTEEQEVARRALAPGAGDYWIDPYQPNLPGQTVDPGTTTPYVYPITPPLSSCVITKAQIGVCEGADEFDNPKCSPEKMRVLPGGDRIGLINTQNAVASIDATARAFKAKYGQEPVYYDYAPRAQVLQSGIAVNTPIYRYLLYPNNAIPPELLRPFPPFGPNDPRAPALLASLYLFYPRGFFDFGGKTPGRFHPKTNRGSFIGNSQTPIAYWYPLVSEEMINHAVAFLKAGGFGAEGGAHGDVVLDTINAGRAMSGLARAGVSFSSALTGGVQNQTGEGIDAQSTVTAIVGTAAASVSAAMPVIGAAIGAGLALFSLFSDIFDSDPDPPPWVKRLAQMDDITWKTGGRYWVGSAPPGTYGGTDIERTAAVCTRFWPGRTAKYNLLDGYAEVMCRMAGTSCARAVGDDGKTKTFAWGPWALGAAVVAAGALVINSRK